mgnify:CR=1 FL=1
MVSIVAIVCGRTHITSTAPVGCTLLLNELGAARAAADSIARPIARFHDTVRGGGRVMKQCPMGCLSRFSRARASLNPDSSTPNNNIRFLPLPLFFGGCEFAPPENETGRGTKSTLGRLPIIENISVYHDQHLVGKLRLRATTISADGPTRDAVLSDYELSGVVEELRETVLTTTLAPPAASRRLCPIVCCGKSKQHI